jgi:hypothetical protein
MLRTGFERVGLSCVFDLATASRCGSAGTFERSSSPSGSCPAAASTFSERAPNRLRFSVANIARSLSFSSRKSTIIPIRMSGSRGREATSDAMRRV